MHYPHLTRLPEQSRRRRAVRWALRWFSRLLIWLFSRPKVTGLEHFPENGPVLIVFNHLGDADTVLGEVYYPVWVDSLAKIELYDFPVLGKLLDAYGVIWVHRGQADRKALRAALTGLRHGRFIAVAPEGRESLTGQLEEGTGGAAYLAVKAGVPILPVTFTGTENWRVFGNLKRLRRTDVTMSVGPLFRLPPQPDLRQAIHVGTETIMAQLARQLPPEYRGVYADLPEA